MCYSSTGGGLVFVKPFPHVAPAWSAPLSSEPQRAPRDSFSRADWWHIQRPMVRKPLDKWGLRNLTIRRFEVWPKAAIREKVSEFCKFKIRSFGRLLILCGKVPQ